MSRRGARARFFLAKTTTHDPPSLS